MNASWGAVAVAGIGLAARKLITREVETALLRKGMNPNAAPFVAAGIVAFCVWAVKK